MTRVKICGLTTEAGIDAAVAAGVDAIGLVFALSVRQVGPARARELLARVPPGIERVAVFRTPDPHLLQQVLELPIDAVQAHHDWDASGLPQRIAFLPWFPDGADLVERIENFAMRPVPPRRSPASPRRRRPGFLGAFVVDGPGAGGTGQPADAERVARAAAYGRMVLAGGLTPDNVAEAVARVRPFGVDVSSGVESAPGVKDPEGIARFVEAVRGR